MNTFVGLVDWFWFWFRAFNLKILSTSVKINHIYAKSQHSNFCTFPMSCPFISDSPNLPDFDVRTLIIPAMCPSVIQKTSLKRWAVLLKEQHKNQKNPLESLFSSHPFFSCYFSHDFPFTCIAHKLIHNFFKTFHQKVPPDFAMLWQISHIEITELRR